VQLARRRLVGVDVDVRRRGVQRSQRRPPAAAPTAPVKVVSPNEFVVSACAPLIVLSKAMAPAVESSLRGIGQHDRALVVQVA